LHKSKTWTISRFNLSGCSAAHIGDYQAVTGIHKKYKGMTASLISLQLKFTLDIICLFVTPEFKENFRLQKIFLSL